jgi:phage terminase small subunit
MGARGKVGGGAARAKLIGAYRRDRDGQHSPPILPGKPLCPPTLKNEARAHWKRIVPDLITGGVVCRADAPALQRLCELWQMYVEAKARFDKKPDSRNRRDVLTIGESYDRLAGRFALTPRDRQATRVPPLVEEDEDDVKYFARDRASGIPSRDRTPNVLKGFKLA